MSNTLRLMEWLQTHPDKWQVHNSSTLRLPKASTMFIPRTHGTTRQLGATCRWCGQWNKTSSMFKLRDGPVDWWFCDDEHALEWLDYRHATPEIHEMLRMPPRMRNLGDKTIEEWVSEKLSQSKSNADALPTSRDGADGVRDVGDVQVPV